MCRDAPTPSETTIAPKPPGNFKPPLSLSGISFFFVILDVSSDDKLLPISFLLLQLSSINSTINVTCTFRSCRVRFVSCAPTPASECQDCTRRQLCPAQQR